MQCPIRCIVALTKLYIVGNGVISLSFMVSRLLSSVEGTSLDDDTASESDIPECEQPVIWETSFTERPDRNTNRPLDNGPAVSFYFIFIFLYKISADRQMFGLMVGKTRCCFASRERCF